MKRWWWIRKRTWGNQVFVQIK